MKSRLALIVTTLALTTAPFATAQETDQRVRRVPAQPTRHQPNAAHQEATSPAQEFLTKNVAITLTGVVGNDIPIDVTLTGCAAKVTSDFILQAGETATVPTIASISYLIREAAEKFTVTYGVSLRIPVVTSTSGPNKSISFQEAALQNTVHCEPGKSVEIYRSGKNSLHLTIGDANPG